MIRSVTFQPYTGGRFFYSQADELSAGMEWTPVATGAVAIISIDDQKPLFVRLTGSASDSWSIEFLDELKIYLNDDASEGVPALYATRTEAIFDISDKLTDLEKVRTITNPFSRAGNAAKLELKNAYVGGYGTMPYWDVVVSARASQIIYIKALDGYSLDGVEPVISYSVVSGEDPVVLTSYDDEQKVLSISVDSTKTTNIGTAFRISLEAKQIKKPDSGGDGTGAYKHGVYVEEVATSVQPASDSDSALPYVVGTALYLDGEKVQDSDAPKPVVISSYNDFVSRFCSKATGEVDPDATAVSKSGFHDMTLVSFADFWFNQMGRGRCVFCGVKALSKATGTEAQQKQEQAQVALLVAALDAIKDVYPMYRLTPTIIACPLFNTLTEVQNKMKALCAQYGGQWNAVGVYDIPCRLDPNGVLVSVKPIESVDAVAAVKAPVDINAYVGYPYGGIGSKRYDASTIAAACMARVDAENGNYPYVSPSNKQCGLDGAYVQASDGSESVVALTREGANASLNANGVFTFRNSAAGWILWGNNTSCYPTSTDVKDNLLPIRRTFQYIEMDFMRFLESKIDQPLNKRQLDGILNSYNQRLKGFIGVGAVNSASIALDDERNTTARLLQGAVYFRLMIAPPPPMQVVTGVFEFDVSGFESSLA